MTIIICITIILCVIAICCSCCYIYYLKVTNNPILFEGDYESSNDKIKIAYQMTTLFKERYILPYDNGKDLAYQGGTREIRTFLDNLLNILL